jgi:hypothetical protein
MFTGSELSQSCESDPKYLGELGWCGMFWVEWNVASRSAEESQAKNIYSPTKEIGVCDNRECHLFSDFNFYESLRNQFC